MYFMKTKLICIRFKKKCFVRRLYICIANWHLFFRILKIKIHPIPLGDTRRKENVKFRKLCNNNNLCLLENCQRRQQQTITVNSESHRDKKLYCQKMYVKKNTRYGCNFIQRFVEILEI